MTTPNIPVSTRYSEHTIERVCLLVKTGIYLSPSEFYRDAARRLLSRYRVLDINDIEFPSAYETMEEIELRNKLHDVIKALRAEVEKKEQMFKDMV